MKPILAALLAALLLSACQSGPPLVAPDGCRYPGQSPECRGQHMG